MQRVASLSYMSILLMLEEPLAPPAHWCYGHVAKAHYWSVLRDLAHKLLVLHLSRNRGKGTNQKSSFQFNTCETNMKKLPFKNLTYTPLNFCTPYKTKSRKHPRTTVYPLAKRQIYSCPIRTVHSCLLPSAVYPVWVNIIF